MILFSKRKIYKLESQRLKGLWLFIFIVFIYLNFCPIGLNAQYYNTGVDNGYTKWRRIKTNRFEVVYPNFYETRAQELVSVLDTLYGVIGSSLKTQPPYIPFLLHTNTAYSNGLSVWAPKRIELWTTTHPTNYPYPWLWHVSIHELRHAAQVYSLKQGVSKTLINIFGEHIYGILLGAFIPTWFLEGDAVVMETAITPSGRGKTPDFNMYFKAQILDKGRYSFDKALLGSMKDYVPNNYILGYYLTSFGRINYNKDIWADMMENVGRNFWKFQFFGRSQQKGLSISTKDLYNLTLDTLTKRWIKEDRAYFDQRKAIPNNKLNKKKEFYSNYYQPKGLNDSTIIALKTSSFEAPRFVKINNRKEEDLVLVGRILHNYYDIKDSCLIFSEYKSHYRWEHENYSDIVEYNINNDTYKSITFNKKIYTPSYNPINSNQIAAVEEDKMNNQHLVIIDKNTGNIIKKFENNILYDKFSYPVWNNDASEIYLIKNNQEGKSIVKYNIQNDSSTSILPSSFNNHSKLKYYNDRLYFISDYENKYQIYSIDLKTNSETITQHTDSRFGVMDFEIIGDKFIISDYTSDGLEIVKQPITQVNTITSSHISPIFEEAEKITKQENFIFGQQHIKDTLFKSEKYRKLTHLFNFHSWSPLYINTQTQDVNFGVSAFSQNLLGSSVLQAGYKYIFSEKRDEYNLDYSYTGWYPILKLNFKYGQRAIQFDKPFGQDFYSVWEEYNIGLNIDLPYSWTDRNYFKGAKYSFYYSFRNIIPDYNWNKSLTIFHTAGFGLSWNIIQMMAENDIVPRFGQTFRLKLQRSITKDNANIIAIATTTFLPGIFRNHSIELNLGFQKNTPTIYYFPNEIPFTKGVVGIFPTYYYGAQFNYHFPVSYSDLSIWKLLYIKRIHSRGFYDIGFFDKEFQSSFGLDINMDAHIFRIEQGFTFGVRLGYLPQLNDYFTNILFNINI